MDRDRERARAWTLGRVLQNTLWGVREGGTRMAPEQVVIVRRLVERR